MKEYAIKQDNSSSFDWFDEEGDDMQEKLAILHKIWYTINVIG